MKRTAWIFLVLVLGGMAVVFGRGVSAGPNNIEVRRAYWQELLKQAALIGRDRAALESFAKTHDQKLDCDSSPRGLRECSFVDFQSAGGTRRIPVKLAAIFTFDGDKVITQQLVSTQNFKN